MHASQMTASLPGLTRQSMLRRGSRRRFLFWQVGIDARVKPAHDAEKDITE